MQNNENYRGAPHRAYLVGFPNWYASGACGLGNPTRHTLPSEPRLWHYHVCISNINIQRLSSLALFNPSAKTWQHKHWWWMISRKHGQHIVKILYLHEKRRSSWQDRREFNNGRSSASCRGSFTDYSCWLSPWPPDDRRKKKLSNLQIYLWTCMKRTALLRHSSFTSIGRSCIFM